ncbi:MAG: hypothetical protein ACLF0G_14215 [Candidatus Brocadiia bacterium]
MDAPSRWLAAAGALALAATAAAGERDPGAYLATVRAYADALLEHGRDVYGSQHSPLFATTLDRQALRLFQGEALARIKSIPRRDWGIRPYDRAVEGANPMHHENLYQVLYALARITGQERYRREADRALAWFFTHCQSPATGLFAWGEHLGWNFLAERRIRQHSEPGTHEFYRPWVLWDRSFRLAPGPCGAFARGLWDHQIADHESGDFSRHAAYDRHGPGRNSQYPRHGGFYIATWAAAYKHTSDRQSLQAIECLVESFDRRRNPKTDALPAETHRRSKGKLMWPGSNLSLAIDLWDGAALVPQPLAERMRASARRTDAVYLRLDHAPAAPDGGFLTRVNTDTLGLYQPGAYTRAWATAYGQSTHADAALLCLQRYRQVRLEGYARLFRQAAGVYLDCEPDPEVVLHPGVMGQVIELMLQAWRTSGEERYRSRAHHFARHALATFFEGSPLPRATSRHDHYEAITRADTLAMALLDLWAAEQEPAVDLGFVGCER